MLPSLGSVYQIPIIDLWTIIVKTDIFPNFYSVDENNVTSSSAKTKRSIQRKTSLRRSRDVGSSQTSTKKNFVGMDDDSDSDPQREYKVEEVLKKREQRGQVEYFVSIN